MNAIIFDALAYAKKLKSAGFTEEQAEVQAEALTGMMISGVVIVAILVKIL